jgi:dihydroxyacetone kinase-like protein
MQKILNDPERFVDEMLDGILAAHPSQLRRVGPRAIVRATAPVADKVAIVTGGGSGHLPVFMGYVGQGLLDGAAIGEVFASPSADQMLEVTEAVSAGRGVLYLYGNYGGDVMNFDLACELAVDEGIEIETVLGTDDVASAPPSRAAERRGVAGVFFAYKCAGAAAEQGRPLKDVAATAQAAVTNTRSMGVGLSPTILPAAGKPTFELGPDEMEIGIGIHGERGGRRGRLETADRIAEDLLGKISEDLALSRGDEVAVLVNGLGATPLEELYVVYRFVSRSLEAMGVRVRRPYIGEFATSLEMAGASLSVMRVTPDLAPLLDAPARSPFYRQ